MHGSRDAGMAGMEGDFTGEGGPAGPADRSASRVLSSKSRHALGPRLASATWTT